MHAATVAVLKAANTALGGTYALARPLAGGFQSGAWLIEETDPSTVMTPEQLSEEHRLIGQTAAEFIEQILERMPFSVRAIQVDNGSEFINAHLYDYCLGPVCGPPVPLIVPIAVAALVALAIVDDLGALLVIAVVYTASMPGDLEYDAKLPYPVYRDPASMLLPTPAVGRRVVEVPIPAGPIEPVSGPLTGAAGDPELPVATPGDPYLEPLAADSSGGLASNGVGADSTRPSNGRTASITSAADWTGPPDARSP